MALQKINWTQIDSLNIPSGYTVNIGNPTGSINNLYADNIYLSGVPITELFEQGSIWQQTGSFYATTNDLQITGSLKISGSLSVTGGINGIGDIETVFYVSEEGDDTNDGKTLDSAFRTIKRAAQAATSLKASRPFYDGLPSISGINPTRVSIQIKTGYYVEEAPITIPSNTSLLGDDLRTVVIRPTEATKTENLFLMNNGTYAWGLRLEGCVIDDLEDPRNGFFFAFAPNAYIVTSPYIQNCTALHTPTDKFYVPLNPTGATPNDLVGNGPGGMIVDDSVLNGYSPLKSMIVDAYTQVAFNGIGLCVRGRGYAQMVSFFTNFSRVGVYAMDGGHASLLNSNTTFGDYGLRASGSRILISPSTSGITTNIDVSGSLIFKNNKNNIRNYMIQRLQQSGSYNSEYNNTGSSIYQSTITDSGLLIDAISDDLLSPNSGRIIQFTTGLFKGQDTTTSSLYTLPPASGFTKGAIAVFPLISNASGSLAGDFIKSYQYIKDYVQIDPDNVFTGVTATTKTRIGQLLDVPINTLQSVVVDNEPTYLQEFGSLITSTSHDFSYAGSGVNFLALPINQGGIGQTDIDIRVYQEDGGRVYHTSGDETGDFYSGNDFVIRQETGTIEGRTFYKAITSVITPINLALETN
jgi:hypothetical protein